MEAAPGRSRIGSYKPQCDEQGRYLPMQCWHATGYCWCVDESGTTVEGTTMRGRPDCQRGRGHRLKVFCICSFSGEAVMDESSLIFFFPFHFRLCSQSYDVCIQSDAEDHQHC